MEDALSATRAAVEEGVVPGGGVALISAINAIKDLANDNPDINTGIVIVRRALEEPMRQLALNANQVMLHQDLLMQVWGPEYRDDVDYLRAYIRYLRRKLEADPSNPRYILNSPGVGYLLACPEQTEEKSGVSD